ncbi:MAG: hypothetical protein ACI3YH_00660 [Eubacteriales bacterium]
MDFETNRKFYNQKHRRKVKILRTVGLPLVVIGGVMLVLGSLHGLGLWILSRFCWIPLVIGGPLWAIALSMKVKESDMLDQIDSCKRDFKEFCEEKLDYPTDLSANAILLTGSESGEDEQSKLLPPRKLKAGGLLYPTVTFTYLYIRRDRLTVYTRRISLCEELCQDKAADYDFADFDGACVRALDESTVKTYAFCLTSGGEVVFTAPVFGDDYTEESFAETILHAKERRR